MKILRYALIGIAVIVVIVIGVVAYIAATFDPNQYKPQIVQAVKDKTQRTLKLDGEIKLSFFPSVGGRLGKATLSERASDKQFAGVEDSGELLSLVGGELQAGLHLVHIAVAEFLG